MSSAFVRQLHVLGAKKACKSLPHSNNLQIPLQEIETRQELNCAPLCIHSSVFFRCTERFPTLEYALYLLI